MHIQAIWKLAFGEGLFNTIRGLNVWGDHCWFIMLVMAPFYRLAPYPETLLILQSAALALGALPLACFAYRRTGGRSVVTLAFAAMWLISPALQNMNLEQFHPEVAVAPLLMLAVDRADAGRWRIYWVALILALCCKEDVALSAFVLGFWIFLKLNKKIGLLTMGICVAWFALCMWVVLPLLNSEGFFRTQGGYWFSDLSAHRFEMGFYRKTLFNMRVAEYGLRLLAPVLFLSLIDPLLLVGMLPSFIINVLSGNVYLVSIAYHYNGQTLPFVFAAAAAGLARCFKNPFRFSAFTGNGLSIAALAASVAANGFWSQAPILRTLARIEDQWSYVSQSRNNERLHDVIKPLDDAGVAAISASYNLVPALANRTHIYMFPNPFKASSWGIRGEHLPSADIVQALILDANVVGEETLAVCSGLIASNQFAFVKREGNFVLLRRVPRQAARRPAKPVAADLSTEAAHVSVYHPGGPVTSLYMLFPGEKPLLVRDTQTVAIPRTSGPLLTTEGTSLGGVDNLRIVFEGRWSFAGANSVTFRVHCDDGCRLYIDDRLVLDYAGIHGFDEERTSAPLRLAPGPHLIRVDYFQWGGDAGLSIAWAGSSLSYQQLQSGQRLP